MYCYGKAWTLHNVQSKKKKKWIEDCMQNSRTLLLVLNLLTTEVG